MDGFVDLAVTDNGHPQDGQSPDLIGEELRPFPVGCAFPVQALDHPINGDITVHSAG